MGVLSETAASSSAHKSMAARRRKSTQPPVEWESGGDGHTFMFGYQSALASTGLDSTLCLQPHALDGRKPVTKRGLIWLGEVPELKTSWSLPHAEEAIH